MLTFDVSKSISFTRNPDVTIMLAGWLDESGNNDDVMDPT